TFEIPADWAQRPLHLSFGMVANGDSTWVNGELIGGAFQFGPREYVIPPEYLRPGQNVLTMRIMNVFGPRGILGEAQVRIWREGDSGESISLAGDWMYKPALRLSELPMRPRPP